MNRPVTPEEAEELRLRIMEERIADLERELTEQAKCNGMGSEREAALMAKVERLERELANEKAKHIHSCHDDCARDGCVNRRLREELAALEKSHQALIISFSSGKHPAILALKEELAAAQATIAAISSGAKADQSELAEAVKAECFSFAQYQDIGQVLDDECEKVDSLHAELAASQAVIARKDESLHYIALCAKSTECLQDECGRLARKALALPADRSALDAMLAEARKEGMLNAAGIAEDMVLYTGLDVAQAIRQAAERRE